MCGVQGLIRQTKVSAASGAATNVFTLAQTSEDMFPLPGHLGVVADAELSHAADL